MKYNINRRKFLGLFGSGCCSLLMPSCATVPITERRQLSIIPEDTINRQAAAAYEFEAREILRHHVSQAEVDGARRTASVEVQAEQYIQQQHRTLQDATTENAALTHQVRQITFQIEEVGK